jgi:DNA-binding IclR family transcriptional regulator
MRNVDGDAVISRAFRLLSAFSGGPEEFSLDELAAASGLARSTAHRLCAQLAQQGALERSGRGWRLGSRLFEMGHAVPRYQRLRDISLPHMGDLYEATHETVQLATLQGSEVLYVEILAGRRKVSSPAQRGGRMPAHCTAVGKAMMAFSEDHGGTALDSSLVPLTSYTLTEPRELRRELHDVRRRGLAFDREEARSGLVCVAGPVFGKHGAPIGALSVSLPAAGRLTVTEVAPSVRAAANALTRELHLGQVEEDRLTTL